MDFQVAHCDGLVHTDVDRDDCLSSRKGRVAGLKLKGGEDRGCHFFIGPYPQNSPILENHDPKKVQEGRRGGRAD